MTPPQGMLADPPQHTFFRDLVQQAFTPRAIAKLKDRVERLAADLLDGIDGDAFDLHDAFAFPLPVIVISEMLGVPPADLHLFKRWSDAAVAAMGEADPKSLQAELGAMAGYLLAQVADRRAHPGRDDLVALLVDARRDGERLADADILSVITQLMVGGNETTTSLITNAVWRLLERPALWQRLIENPDLVGVALEESLRFDPPVLGLFRNTTRAVELHGVTIPEGSKVMLHYAAANRDPGIWDTPDEFSLDRAGKRHLAFGLGVHFCLGAQLARLEAATSLSALLARMPNLQLLGAGERIAPFFLWGRRHLAVRVR